jgi:predicted extracellular nuclease
MLKRLYVFIGLLLLTVTGLTAQDAVPVDCDTTLELWQIQGAVSEANCTRERVTTTENVVTAIGDFGFFIQSPADRTDDDPLTSDGVYVATRFPPATWGISVGDHVVIDGGRVVEQFEMTQINVTSESQITIVSNNNPIPEPVDLTTVDYTQGEIHPLERYEGMLVTLADAAVQAPTNYFDEFIITATGDRAFRETGVESDRTPDLIGLGLPEWDLNPEVFEVDPPEMGYDPLFLTRGDVVTVTGGLAYSFQDYQIWPRDLDLTNMSTFEVQPVRPAEAGEFTIATQNFQNLFDTIDDPDRADSTGEDYVPDTQEAYDERLDKVAAQIITALNAPDIVALQEIENENVVDDITARINQIDPTLDYAGCIFEGNDGRGIDNAYLTRRDTVTVEDCFQLPGTLDAIQSGNNPLYGRPPLVLVATLGENAYPVTLINLHIKSLGGIETTTVQERRLMQAVGIGEYVQALQAAGDNVIVLGDLNAFEFSDGIVDVVGIISGDEGEALMMAEGDIVEPDLVNQVGNVPPDERFSFMFNGSYQVLDHILTSQTVAEVVTDAQFSRGNAEALYIWEDEANGAMRSSDHDGFVIYLAP